MSANCSIALSSCSSHRAAVRIRGDVQNRANCAWRSSAGRTSGKSSLLNRILGEDRVIVSPVAGTTRDAIDTVLQTPERKFRLIDTAGIRRKGKTDEMAEKLSVIMARKSLERADVAIVLVDAVEGVTALDATIAGYAVDAGCSIIIAVNKWDAVKDKETNTASEFERELARQDEVSGLGAGDHDLGADGTTSGEDSAAGFES